MSEDLGSVHEGLARAVRRLSVLEYLILLGIVVLALLGGALLALLLEASADLPFRVTWMVASVLFFAVPGTIVLLRDRTRSRSPETDDLESNRNEDHG